MKNAKQKRRDKLNQPTDWGVLVDHTPGQMPRIVDVDAELHFKELLLASHRASKRRAQLGGLARAETFLDPKEQAEKTAQKIWSVEPDRSCRNTASMIAKRAGQHKKAETIRRWIAHLRPSTQ